MTQSPRAWTSNRRRFLRGVGGLSLGLPLLEGLGGCTPPTAEAGRAGSWAIFFRQPCGVASRLVVEDDNDQVVEQEPELFWPRQVGALTAENVAGRALDELDRHLQRLLVVGNVNYSSDYAYGDGHASGAFQGLTARGPLPGTEGGPFWEASGESIDMFIARHQNLGGTDSLYLHAGAILGWLGGACISHRGPGERNTAERDPYQAFSRIVGDPADVELSKHTHVRRQSVNDLVLDQMDELMQNPRLSAWDQRRLRDHFDAIRTVETKLTCRRDEELETRLITGSGYYDDPNGQNLLDTIELHLEVAALAVACGVSRSVVLQVGDGNGGDLRFHDRDTGQLMENFHFVSHRRRSHLPEDGAQIEGAARSHHLVDREFARLYSRLLDRLVAYELPDGRSLLDSGVAVWYNDNANGPQHCSKDTPWILAGSAGGFLKQGEYVDAVGRRGGHWQCHRPGRGAPYNLHQLHNTIATAAGVRKPNGEPVDDFGDPAHDGGLLANLMT